MVSGKTARSFKLKRGVYNLTNSLKIDLTNRIAVPWKSTEVDKYFSLSIGKNKTSMFCVKYTTTNPPLLYVETAEKRQNLIITSNTLDWS